MTSPDQELVDRLYEKAANGNDHALTFLKQWHQVCHQIDDFIDEGRRDPEEFLAILAQLNIVYSLPFYVRHASRLHVLVSEITSDFALSIEWEKADEDWKRQMADLLRFSGNSMVEAVADIEGNYDLRRQLSPILKEVSWRMHHSKEGKAE